LIVPYQPDELISIRNVDISSEGLIAGIAILPNLKLVTWDGWLGRRPDPFQEINPI